MNKERLLKIIEDMYECTSDIDECIDILDNNKENALMVKLAKSSLRQLFDGKGEYLKVDVKIKMQL